jgi:hypothetical protein
VYTIDEKGYIYIAYTDNTSQTLVALATEDGMILNDINSSSAYFKK